MLAFDKLFREENNRGNVCALSLFFRDARSLEFAVSRILSSAITAELASLRLHRASWRPYWRQGSSPERLIVSPVSFSSEQELENFVMGYDCDPRVRPPLQFVQFRLGKTRSGLMFFWHHALMDARGAENFLASLLAGDLGSRGVPFISVRKPGAFSPKKIRQVQTHIVEVSKDPVLSFAREPLAMRKGYRYHRIHFSPAETLGIDRRCRESGAEVFKSSVYLSALSRAAKDIFGRRGIVVSAFHLCVPHNLRRSKKKYFLGNQVTFFFYRIPRDVLESVEQGMRFLVEASHAIIADGLQQSLELFFQFASYLPLPLFRHFLLKPSRGTLASFYFSDTGEMFSGISIPSEVLDAIHYPPHFTRPGLTAVFSRFQGALTAMLIVGEQVLTDEELQRFERSLRRDLEQVECEGYVQQAV